MESMGRISLATFRIRSRNLHSPHTRNIHTARGDDAAALARASGSFPHPPTPSLCILQILHLLYTIKGGHRGRCCYTDGTGM